MVLREQRSSRAARRDAAGTSASHAARAGRIDAVCITSVPDGFGKQPTAAGTLLAGYGFEGDRHAGRDSTRAVALMDAAHLEAFRFIGMRVMPGAMGENMVVSGIDTAQWRPGLLIRLGPEAVIRLTEQRRPCRELEDIAHGLLRAAVGRAGWFAAVIRGGPVGPGDSVETALPAFERGARR